MHSVRDHRAREAGKVDARPVRRAPPAHQSPSLANFLGGELFFLTTYYTCSKITTLAVGANAVTGKSLPHITGAELWVMKALWNLGSGTVRQVLDALPSHGGGRLAYTTIMTMMKQLAEKGALTVDRERQPFVYAPAVCRDRVLGSRLTQFLQTVFDGQAEDLVLHLAEQADLSPEDLRRIEAKIRSREQAERQQRGQRDKGPEEKA